jgi:branched-subunit amino acid transport protein
MNELTLILGMMAVTAVVRYPVLALVGRFDLPAPVFNALKFVPVAVLTAISVPEMLSPGGTLSLSYTNAHLVAGVVAVLAAIPHQDRRFQDALFFGRTHGLRRLQRLYSSPQPPAEKCGLGKFDLASAWDAHAADPRIGALWYDDR